MADVRKIPDATMHRLALYHCYLGEIIEDDTSEMDVTSVVLAQRLGLGESTVRRDLSYVGAGGRSGVGYEWNSLYDALTEFLGLREEYPIIRIGSAKMLEALQVVCPSGAYGVHPVAYFSEVEADSGSVVGNVEVLHVNDIPRLDPAFGVQIAFVACSPEWTERVLDLLAQVGIEGVLLLAPRVQIDYPAGMRVRHVRMPCDIKALACQCRTPVTA